jgi:hypothetical protein
MLLTAITLTALLGATAFAQPGDRGPRGDRGDRGFRGFGRGFGELMQPEFLPRDMRFIVEQLSLDDSQATITEALLLDYRATFDESLAEMRDRAMEQTMGGVTPEQREQRAQERRAAFEQMREVREEIRALRERMQAGGESNEQIAAEIEARVEQMRAQWRGMRDLMPSREERRAMLDEFADRAVDWINVRERLRQQFMTDLQTVLSERQMEDWSAFTRAMRRMKSMSRGEFAGESVDLIQLVDQLDLEPTEREQIQAVLEPYAISLDEALKVRDEYLDESRPKLMDAMAAGDLDRARTMIERENQLRQVVRMVNDRYADAVLALAADGLAAETAAAFRQAWREAAYPRIYRTTPMQRAFDAALELEGLDQDLIEAIRAIRDSYLADLAVRNSGLVQLTRKSDAEQAIERLEMIAARMDGNMMIPPDNPLRDAFRERMDLERDYRTQLEALLTEEQIEQLPPMRERGARGDRPNRGDRGDRRRGPRDRGDWAERMREFDTNGDGMLDEAEQQRMREAMRERFREQRDRGEGRGGQRGGGGGPGQQQGGGENSGRGRGR